MSGKALQKALYYLQIKKPCSQINQGAKVKSV